MRDVAPIALAGVTPRDLSNEPSPTMEHVDPRGLFVDDTYQRTPSPRTLALVRRIVEGWSWAKFKPPVVVRVGEVLHVLDGQHTAMAAASHPGISAIPVLVVAAPKVADRAAAFVSHAIDRVQANPLAVHRAAVVAGDAAAVAVDTVCRKAGVELLGHAPGLGDFRPRDTIAVSTIRSLLARRGADGARAVLAALAAADLAPIAGDHIQAADALLWDETYAGEFDGARVAATFRAMTPAIMAEARALAAAKQLPAWRALTATLYRRAPKRARAKAPPAPAAQPARVAPAAVLTSPALIGDAEPSVAPKPMACHSALRPRSAEGPEKVIMPSLAMARIVGIGPLLRSDGVERLWRYVNGNDLLDPADRHVVIADDKLRAVFGRDRIAVRDLEVALGPAIVPAVPVSPAEIAYRARSRARRHTADAAV